jgi:hypothetical protein
MWMDQTTRTTTVKIPKSLQSILTDNFYRTGSQIGVLQPIVFAFLLLLQNIGVIIIAPEFTKWISIWTAFNVFSLVGIVRTGVLFSRRGGTKRCIHCDSKDIAPATFMCLNCGSVVGPSKQMKEKMA